jgi:carboxyl-terminal processing protease
MGLVFGIGVQVGSKTGTTQVDEAISTILSSGAKQNDREILERAAIEGALKASGDEWANYFPKSALEVLEEQSSNMFTGIGVWFTKSRGGQVKIASIQEDSPAFTSGLSVGDQVLEVNGTDVRGASLTSVIALIRGEVGSKIELLVDRDEKKILVDISTEKVAVRTVEASQVTDSVALIQISSFGSGTADDVQKSLSKLKYKSGIIIDLRNNPGGLIEESVRVAQLFISSGLIVSYQVNGNEKLFKVSNPKPITVPVILMINRNTASSAEILAGAFQDRNRGVVIGERSYGKGSVQELVTLDDGSKLELTVALYRTPSGRVIEELGIIPDLEASSSEIGIKALQVLGGLASLTSQK